jgi:small-conductance mechanosensitive channel
MFNEELLKDALLPAALLAAGFIAGVIFERLVLRKLHRVFKKTQWEGINVVIGSLRGITIIWFTVAGASAAVNNIIMPPSLYTLIQRILLVIIILSATLLLARLATGFIKLYTRRGEGIEYSISIFSHLTTLIIFIIGLMIILQTLGISITPLITALGIGGLAVALALQDTLSNLFSGLLIIATGQIKQGDYVKLESGSEGYVTDITWKNTTIRAIPNNMVIVPNSKLSSTIITNYYQPHKELLVRVEVGVSYESDLRHVERVTVDVARGVMKGAHGGVPGFEPYVRFHTFADFSINFTVVMSAGEYFDQYRVKHEFVKKLHERYRTEGIVIPFPIRTVYMDQKTEPHPIDAPPETITR